MTKKQLRIQLMNICQGAGMPWVDDGYFEFNDDPFLNLGMVISAVEREFLLHDKNRLRNPNQWYKFNDLEEMIDIISEAIELDRAE